MEEIWKAIPDHPGYDISNLGRARSVDRVITNSLGRQAKLKGRILKPGLYPFGYHQYALGENFRAPAHRLVLEAFVGKAPPLFEACHCDGNPKNNRLDNLRWDTRRGNFSDKKRHGTDQIGIRHGMAKLTEDQVKAIRNDPRPSSHIARDYGVDRSLPLLIKKRKIWKHL